MIDIVLELTALDLKGGVFTFYECLFIKKILVEMSDKWRKHVWLRVRLHIVYKCKNLTQETQAIFPLNYSLESVGLYDSKFRVGQVECGQWHINQRTERISWQTTSAYDPT